MFGVERWDSTQSHEFNRRSNIIKRTCMTRTGRPEVSWNDTIIISPISRLQSPSESLHSGAYQTTFSLRLTNPSGSILHCWYFGAWRKSFSMPLLRFCSLDGDFSETPPPPLKGQSVVLVEDIFNQRRKDLHWINKPLFPLRTACVFSDGLL